MSIKKIKELVDLMKDNDLAEVEVEQEGLKVRLIKTGQSTIERVPVTSAPAVSPTPTAELPDKEHPGRKAEHKELKSPMVGTFYRSPSPDTDPYVQTGDVIQKGDVLCIVEAMKLMNEVKAEFGGKVIQVLVENGDAVEYGQALFLVEPL
jgi:acetyl-CoA carboxylase biotin carboxyl carrier protein